MKSTLFKSLIFIGLVPISFIIGTLSFYIYRFLIGFSIRFIQNRTNLPDIVYQVLVEWGSGAVSGMAVVYISYIIAPQIKKFLSTIIGLFYIIVIILFLIGYFQTNLELTLSIFNSIGFMVGLVGMIVLILFDLLPEEYLDPF